MTQPARLGLVGAGAIAQAYVQAIEREPGVVLSGVADIREDAARAAAEPSGCPSYVDYRELASNGPCDGIVVCTPPDTHEEVSTFFLEHDLPVLCEKPLSTSVESAERMLRTAERTGVLLTMASKFRYADDVVRAKSLLSSGVLGEIILFENAFTARVDMSSRWNSNPAISGGGVLIDNGTHSVDLIRYFLGPVKEVQAVEGKRVQTLGVEDTVQIFVRSESGVMATIDLSWSINKELDSYINIYGSQGVIRVGWKESRYRQTASSDWVTFGKGYDKVESFRNQLRNFAGALAGAEELRIGPSDALASVRAIEAAYQSLASTNWIAVGNGRP